MADLRRVSVYIDGFNLYYGLREKKWKCYYWLDIRQMANGLLRSREALVKVHYFTARVPQPNSRQKLYLEALETISDVQIDYGKFIDKKHTCHQCGNTDRKPEEKRTDVNIAVALLDDAYQDVYDRAILISADSDLVGPLNKVHSRFPNKKVHVAFPPKRQSRDLRRYAASVSFINEANLRKSQMPTTITKKDGYVLKRPSAWQ